MQKALKVISNKADKSILLTLDKPYYSLIWLHGLGDTSAGFLDYFQQKDSPVYQGARVKLLHAPIRPVTINGGIPYTSWYDIKVLSGAGSQKDRYNFQEINDSLAVIDKYVTEQINFWKESGLKDSNQQILKRIFVGGFSQGCAMSLCYGLNADKSIAGVVGFSGHLFQFLPMKNKGTLPMLVYHGDSDEVLNYQWVKPLYTKYLKDLPNFSFKLLQGLGHTVTMQQLKKSSQWMLEQLKKNDIVG